MSEGGALERLDSRLREARERLDNLERNAREAFVRTPDEDSAPATEPPPGLDHVLFVPTPAGYALVESQGSPPAAGETVTLPDRDGAYVAAKVADSPLPGDPRPCVYLLIP